MLVQVLCHTAKALPIRQLVTCSSQHQCGKMQKSVQNTRAEPVQALRSCRYAVCRSYSCGTQSSPPSRQCSTSCKCAPPINKSISPGGRTLLHTRPASHLAMLPVLRAVPVRHSDLSMLGCASAYVMRSTSSCDPLAASASLIISDPPLSSRTA